ncbi:MAG: type II secretion system F family protein [Candidatus Omnitrophota bacterium]
MSDLGPAIKDEGIGEYECSVTLRDGGGGPEKKILYAHDKDEVVEQLLKQGYLIVSIKENKAKRRKVKKARPAGSGKRSFWSFEFSVPFLNRVSARELIFFANQLAALLSSGVSITRSFEIIRRGLANAGFRSVLQDIHDKVSGGMQLCDAVKGHPRVFPPIWQNLIEVGELSGNLPNILKEISRYQESSESVKSKVVSALIYPAILVCVATGALTFLMISIIPKFEEIFVSQNLVLPVPTQIVIAMSRFIRYQSALGVLIVLAIGILVSFYLKTPAGIAAFHRLVLRLPIIGGLMMKVASFRFCRSLATLTQAGVPILRGLSGSAKLTGNRYLEETILEVQDAVSKGKGLGANLEQKNVFPTFMTQLIAVGEESGDLQGFCHMIANYYETQVDDYLKRMTTLIEPLLLVVMGILVGFIVVSVFLPILQMTTGGS